MPPATDRTLGPQSLLISLGSPRRLWTTDHLIRVVGQNGLGLIVLLGAAVAAFRSNGDIDRAQLWFNVSVAGLVISGIANGLWLLRLRRAVTEARLQMTDVVAARLLPVSAHVTKTGSEQEHRIVTAAGQRRFHRADCAFVARRAVSDHDRSGMTDLRPCEVCLP